MGAQRVRSYSLLAKSIHWAFIGVFAYAVINQIDEVEELERQLDEAREDVKKAVKQGFDALCDGGYCPITFDEFWDRSEFNKLKEKGE